MLRGKAIAITGAGRGLGRGYALEAARQGASVVVNDVDGNEAETVVAEIVAAGGTAIVQSDSIATWDGARAVVDACTDSFGRIDGLVNNAGILYSAPSHEDREEQMRQIVEINLLGAMFAGTHAMRAMVEQGGGAILNIVSSGQMGAPKVAAYSATKGGLATLTYCWSIDMEPFGVRVNGFAPSAFTRMSAASGVPVALQAPPIERNVGAVTYLLSDRAEGITGQIVQLDRHDLKVVAHPQLSDAGASAEEWTPELIAEQFDPVLRANLQPVGWGPALAART